MKKRLLFVFFCSILLCLSLSAFASDGDEPVLNVICQNQGHDVEVLPGSEATCLHPGKTEGSVCKRCGMILNPQVVIPAKGHTLVVDEAVPVTCESDGLTAGSHCSVCGQVIERQMIITTTGHHTVVDKGYPSTCSERGRTDGSHCAICGKVFFEQVVLPLLDHEFTESKVRRTCTTDGYTLHTCKNCGFTYMSDFVYAPGHQLKTTPGYAQTCTKAGKTPQSTCTVCGKVVEKSESIPPFGHQWKEKITKATIKKDGLRVIACSVCGKKKSETPIPHIASIKLSATKYIYDKTAKTPTVTVKDTTGKKLKYKTDYKLAYDSGRKNPGTYYVTVVFRGIYKDTKALKFKIMLPAAQGLQVKAGKNRAVLNWEKTLGAQRYAVYYALTKNGTYKKIGTTDKLTCKVKNLTPGATYFFKICPVTTDVNGDKVYGGWSKVKGVKVY